MNQLRFLIVFAFFNFVATGTKNLGEGDPTDGASPDPATTSDSGAPTAASSDSLPHHTPERRQEASPPADVRSTFTVNDGSESREFAVIDTIHMTPNGVTITGGTSLNTEQTTPASDDATADNSFAQLVVAALRADASSAGQGQQAARHAVASRVATTLAGDATTASDGSAGASPATTRTDDATTAGSRLACQNDADLRAARKRQQAAYNTAATAAGQGRQAARHAGASPAVNRYRNVGGISLNSGSTNTMRVSSGAIIELRGNGLIVTSFGDSSVVRSSNVQNISWTSNTAHILSRREWVIRRGDDGKQYVGRTRDSVNKPEGVEFVD